MNIQATLHPDKREGWSMMLYETLLAPSPGKMTKVFHPTLIPDTTEYPLESPNTADAVGWFLHGLDINCGGGACIREYTVGFSLEMSSQHVN